MGTTRRAETISANFRMQLLAIKTGYSQTKRSKDTKPTNKQITHTHTHTQTQSKQRQEEAADRQHTKSESEIFTTQLSN